MYITLLPSEFIITDIVAAFVAGPAIKKTNAAPGSSPFEIKTIAIGTEAVAHTYIGTEAIPIKIMARIPFIL